MNKYLSAFTGKDEATIFLYGPIGDYWEDGNKTDSTTSVEFVRMLNELESKYDTINVRINSPGGSVFEGNAIVSAIRNSNATINTYNDGLAASMAALIWAAGDVRHMNKHALLMLHTPYTIAIGNARDLRNEADVLDKIALSGVNIIASATGMRESEVMERFFDYNDHWLNADDVVKAGLLNGNVLDGDVQVPDNVQQMSIKEVFAWYEQHGGQDQKKALGKSIIDFVQRLMRPAASVLSTQTNLDMTLEDFKQNFEHDEEFRQAVVALVADATKADPQSDTDDTPAPAQDAQPDPTAALQELIDQLCAQIAELQQRLTVLEAQPAEPPTMIDNDDPDLGKLSPAERQAVLEFRKINQALIEGKALS